MRWSGQGRLGLLAENGTRYAKSWRKNVPGRWDGEDRGREWRRVLHVGEQTGCP